MMDYRFSEEESRRIFFAEFPGGNYTAVQNTDGTWDLQEDIPIMSAVPAEARGNDDEVGTPWMRKALDQHKRNEKEQGHLPPIHIAHHGDGKKNERVGFFRLSKVGKIRQDGKDRPALFARFLRLTPEAFERIKAMDFPYRSVEIARWEKPEVASLALLSDDSPFFKMEMLTIGREVPNPLASRVSVGAEVCGVAAFAEGGGAYLFNLRGVTTRGEPMGDEIYRFEDEKKDDDNEKKGDEEAEGESIEAMVSTLKGIGPLVAELKKLMTALDAGTTNGEEETGGEEEEEEEEKDEEAKLVKAPVGSSLSETVAKQEAKIASMEMDLYKSERSRLLSQAIEASMGELEGYAKPANLRQRMYSMCQAADDPMAILTPFIETFKETARESGSDLDTLEDFERQAAQPGAPDLSAYAGRGPGFRKMAEKFSAQFNELRDLGMGLSGVSREEFIDSGIESEQYEAAVRSGDMEQVSRVDRARVDRLCKPKKGA